MQAYTEDTICALSTAPGSGAIAIVRISGREAVTIADSIFSRDLTSAASHRAIFGTIREGERIIDEAVAIVFRGPHSFTGEDTVEFNCHGSQYVQQEVLRLLIEAGARLAKPGEFSMRAYLSGRMDLSQAEAIGDLIAAESEAAHRQAMHQMRGGFSKEIHQLRDQLIHFASLVELELDFSEEDVEFANRPQLRQLVEEIQRVVLKLKDSFALGNALKNGLPVAILGAPNAGKSTLLNALLNEERAIVSEIAGTTRDTIEDQITIEGIRFRFIDTAGIRDTQDTIERLGIERSFAKAREAQIILLLFDVTSTTPEVIRSLVDEIRDTAGHSARLLLLANKIDQLTTPFDEATLQREVGEAILPLSAKTRHNLDALKTALGQLAGLDRPGSGETIVTNLRHYEALVRASASIADILHGLDTGLTGDFLAVDIRKTLYHLGEITGTINADDLLNSIFSRFCIGK